MIKIHCRSAQNFQILKILKIGEVGRGFPYVNAVPASVRLIPAVFMTGTGNGES